MRQREDLRMIPGFRFEQQLGLTVMLAQRVTVEGAGWRGKTVRCVWKIRVLRGPWQLIIFPAFILGKLGGEGKAPRTSL